MLLHAEYDTQTGDIERGSGTHLQVDATSIWLLVLLQMAASGLHVITIDEVNFVKWFITLVEPTVVMGFGRRGNKINPWKSELNASSIGAWQNGAGSAEWTRFVWWCPWRGVTPLSMSCLMKLPRAPVTPRNPVA